MMGKLAGSWWKRVHVVVVAAGIALSGCSSSHAPERTNQTCVSDETCGVNQHCDPHVGCAQCRFDTQCGVTERCDRGECITRFTCDSNADCTSPALPTCEPTLRECVQCTSDKDCKSGQICDAAHDCSAQVTCKNSLDCASNQVCTSGQCAECGSEADCPAGSLCSQHQCEPTCSSDKDCLAQGLLCNALDRRCVQCLSSADCPNGYHCDAGGCLHNVCEIGSTKCDPNSDATLLCSPAGDRYLTLFCTDGQACSVQSGTPGCQNWQCTPNAKKCSTDGQRVERCAADGLSSRVQQECGADQACVAGSCVDLVCEPGKSFCQAGAVRNCNADGTASAVVQQCDASSFCDDATAMCTTIKCAPNQVACHGNQYGRCKGDGSGFEALTDCAAGQVCFEGACWNKACDPGAEFCGDNSTVKSCDSIGATSEVTAICDSAHHCVQNGRAASCDNDPCTPSAPACSDNVVTQCKADGSGYEAGGTDCNATGQVCANGACVPKVCDADTLFCSGGNVYLCTGNGSAQQLFQTCDSTQYCNPVAPSCQARVCTPGALGCNGKLAATCNAEGSGYTTAGAVDCSASGKACVAGNCVAVSCTANQLFCLNGDVYRCDSTGTSSTLSTDCYDPSQHCESSGNVTQCVSDVCSDNALSCSGNTLFKCNGDGSGYASSTDCGAQACTNGACLPKICTPGALTCSSGNSSVCNPTGTAYVTNQVCSGTTTCSPNGTCVPLACAPGAAACVGEVSGTCNTTGSAEIAGGTSCSASSKVCSLSGCASSASDQLSTQTNYVSLPDVGPTILFGAAVYISNNRRLTDMKLSLYDSANTQLRFVVYSSTAQAGPYTPVADVLVNVAGATANQYADSGALNLPLSAGKFYFFGGVAKSLQWNGDNTNAASFLSFGKVVGGYHGTLSAAGLTPPNTLTNIVSTSPIPAIQLTTILP